MRFLLLYASLTVIFFSCSAVAEREPVTETKTVEMVSTAGSTVGSSEEKTAPPAIREAEKEKSKMFLDSLETKSGGVMGSPGLDAGFADDKLLCSGKSYSDGTFLFFPLEHRINSDHIQANVIHGESELTVQISRQGKRQVDVVLPVSRQVRVPIPLDILFIFDTTGSMGEEIQRLKTTIELIYLNLTSLSVETLLRFGMVLYRDVRDEYVTNVIPLTGNLSQFQQSLSKVEAGGGGDFPEDLQSALHDALRIIEWNDAGISLCFIITDAPPHLDYGQTYTYVDAVHDAREAGIKIFGVGTGGLNLQGEIVLRQIAQYTAAKYIFLTYGETGESEGGRIDSVSHHTGSNYQTDKLDSIIIRIAKEELHHQTDHPVATGEEYFIAAPVEYEEREETMSKLFGQALSQLVDYSTYRLKERTTASIIPVIPADEMNSLDAEYFTEQLMIALSRNDTFRTVERRNLQTILEELELQLSGLIDEHNAVKVGDLLGTQVLVSSNLYMKENEYELFLKLLRVATGEILSVTKTRIDKRLGLSNPH